MIVVVAGAADAEAEALVERWASADAALLTPEDLSHGGWEVGFPDPGPRFVAAGATRATAEISGVLVRTPAVSPFELPHLRDVDRDYASAEMTALLSYWLSALDCPVINHPSPSFLLGPAWTNAQWLTVAARLGLRVSEVIADSEAEPQPMPSLAWVTVVGNRTVARGVDAERAAHALALSERVGAALLAVGFEIGVPAQVSAVSTRPVISEEVADALLVLLGGSER